MRIFLTTDHISLTEDNTADKKIIYAIVVIAVIAVAAVGIYLLINNDKEKPVGEYAEYTVSGSAGATTFSGTMKVTVVSETSKQYKIEYVYDIYQTTSGVKTPFMVDTETVWENKNDLGGRDMGVKQGSTTTITTSKWGSKEVDVYVNAVPGEPTMTTYVGTADGIPYRMTMTVPASSINITFNLSDTNLF